MIPHLQQGITDTWLTLCDSSRRPHSRTPPLSRQVRAIDQEESTALPFLVAATKSKRSERGGYFFKISNAAQGP